MNQGNRFHSLLHVPHSHRGVCDGADGVEPDCGEVD